MAKETDSAEAVAEVAALRDSAAQYEDHARGCRDDAEHENVQTASLLLDEAVAVERVARACRVMADVLAQDAALVERVARGIAVEVGLSYDEAYENKREWSDDRGKKCDVNGPFKADYRAAARAALAAMLQKENADG